jgi:hypothetical protein
MFGTVVPLTIFTFIMVLALVASHLCEPGRNGEWTNDK